MQNGMTENERNFLHIGMYKASLYRLYIHMQKGASRLLCNINKNQQYSLYDNSVSIRKRIVLRIDAADMMPYWKK